MNVFSVADMARREQKAHAEGMSYETMMQHAGGGVARWVETHLSLDAGVIGLIGSGNNGGDTLIALRDLSLKGVRTLAFSLKERGDDQLLEAYQSAGGTIVTLSHGENLDLLEAVLNSGMIMLDGVLGTGFRPPLRGALQGLLLQVQAALNHRSGLRIIAVDCPSGVDCDSGAVAEGVLTAEATLTLSAVKEGLLKFPARDYCGEIHLIPIGIEDVDLVPQPQKVCLIQSSEVRPRLPKRPSHSHKGTFGTCLVIAGSEPFIGAAFLAGKAAYKAGCGLVHMAALPEVQQSLSGKLIEAVWTRLEGKDGSYHPDAVPGILPLFASADSMIVGPGWGQSENNRDFLAALLPQIPNAMPLLVDADGLKLLSRLDRWWSRLPEKTVLTPHPGEMAVLTGLPLAEIEGSRWAITRQYAQEWGVTLVLKGAVSAIASPLGTLWVNPASESALATAGSGDVLSGVIGGLMAQGLSPLDAAISGVWLHGSAGKYAHQTQGTDVSVTALDILKNLGPAFADFQLR